MSKSISDGRLVEINRVGTIESVSLLILLLIAMPMKYIWDDPTLVRWVGMIHGILFIAYVIVVIRAQLETRWPLSYTFWGIMASFIPFGPTLFVKRLRERRELSA